MDELDHSPPPFHLPSEDKEYLDAFTADNGSRWEPRAEGPDNCKWGLFIHDFPIPPGYDRERSTLMILVPTGYPGAGLDMFYFYPWLARSDGQEIGALAEEGHFDTNWQRWSRHYDWNPGEHNICSHVEYILEELKTETSE